MYCPFCEGTNHPESRLIFLINLCLILLQSKRLQKPETAGTGSVNFEWDQCDNGFPYCCPAARWWRLPVRLAAPAASGRLFPQLGHGFVHGPKTFRSVCFPMPLRQSGNGRSSLCRKRADGIQFEMNLLPLFDWYYSNFLQVEDAIVDLWIIIYFEAATCHLLIPVGLIILACRWYRKRTIWAWFQIQLAVSLLPISSTYFLQAKLLVSLYKLVFIDFIIHHHLCLKYSHPILFGPLFSH